MPYQPCDLRKYIRDIPDWPRKGILFRDITPLLAEPAAFTAATDALARPFANDKIEYVAAIEARGFIFGACVAEKLKAGFVPIRKKGKLPYETQSVTYDLEYGSDTLEVHRDAVRPGAKVLLIDDLLATGGTISAAAKLLQKIGAKLAGIAFLIELTGLNGRQKLPGYRLHCLISY